MTPVLAVGVLLATALVAPLAHSYDAVVLADKPIAYVVQGRDLTGRHAVTRNGTQRTARMPNGDSAPLFGNQTWWGVADADDLSVTQTKLLTVEVWLRPDTLDFTYDEGTTGYVYWLGKSNGAGQHEYAGRMYSTHSPGEVTVRRNRISFYGWLPSGGLGTGAYVQRPVYRGQWLHVVSVFDARKRDGYPLGSVSLWFNGELVQTVSMTQHDTVMCNGNAPLRIGTRNMGSFFEGAVGKVAVYDRILKANEIQAHHRTMKGL